MDIFKDSTSTDSTSYLEIDRFKAKILEIWSRMLTECYSHYFDEDDEDSPSMEEFLEANALKFSDEPEAESELDSLMDMLDGLMDEHEEHEHLESEGKAPTYSGKQLSSHNETSKTEKTKYEYQHQATKTPGNSQSGVKGGSYKIASGKQISKKKEDAVIRKYSPLLEEIKDDLRALSERQKIGRRKLRFRL